MKHIFLINNKAGKSNYILESKIYQACQDMNLDFKLVLSDNVETLKENARIYKNEDAIVYAVGGDGTIQVILNELMGGKAKLGIIPFGTGNDFYRSLNEYRSEYVNTNVMNVNGRYGLNVFSLGIDAEICANAEKLKKLPIPKDYLYHLSAVYTFFKYRTQVMGINDFFEKKTLLAICNGSYYGGGHNIAPRASIHTPDVFIVSVEDMPKFKMPLFWLDVMRGMHEDNPCVDLFISNNEIHIETMNTINGQLDGEIMIGNEFNIIPAAGTVEIVNNRNLIRELTR